MKKLYFPEPVFVAKAVASAAVSLTITLDDGGTLAYR
jgi:hypothetical protein